MATISDVVAHVAIGSDFDGAALPVDMKDNSEMHKLMSEFHNYNNRYVDE